MPTATLAAPYQVTSPTRLAEDGTFGIGKKYTLTIHDLPNEQKPREKLLRQGPSALSVAELVAILFGTGSKKEDVLTLSARVVKEYGERSLFEYTDAERLGTEFNLPAVKALQIIACGELGRRLFQKKNGRSPIIRTAKDVAAHTSELNNLPKEQLRGLYLDSHQRLLHDEVISIGTLNASLIHPREVFKPAIAYNAAAVIVVHNHPSGVTTPSSADREITRQLAEAGNIIGIPLLDHVIVAGEKFKSIEF